MEWAQATHLVGHLHEADRRGAVSFVYAQEWLDRPEAFPIDPTSLALQRGAHHRTGLFGAVQDCGPDRWGKTLIERAARQHVLEAKPYGALDYVLAMDDATRIGALRFRAKSGDPFLAETRGRIPPLIQLGALLHAADAVHGERESASDLRYLLGAGSPLGGARPKSAVALPDGRLALAKFPKPDDTRDIAAGEILALTLARQAGIRVAEHQLVTAQERNISLITRFDRTGTRRIPFLSGSSLLGLPTDEPGAYTLLADGLRRFGDDITSDLRELWRRLVFSLLASNYDDHLRNHGFLMHTAGRWSLSPAYDLNPVPEIDRALTPKTWIDEGSSETTVQRALDVASRFALSPTEAKTTLRKMYHAVKRWRETGRSLRIKAATLDAYATAFENPRMAEALAMGLTE